MTTMIHDQLCESLLNKYGISYGNLFKDYVVNVLETHSTIEEPAPGTYSGYVFVFKYAFANMAIDDNSSLEKYNKFFDDKFPHITSEGKFVLDLIDTLGYDTPEKLSYLYQTILNAMELHTGCKLFKT